MMKRLSDAQVAKALGWKRKMVKMAYAPRSNPYWRKPGEKDWVYYDGTFPQFTTSLDAIVGECKRQGVTNADLEIPEYKLWDPEAICAALMKFLEAKEGK
jgi:hypothetical protein